MRAAGFDAGGSVGRVRGTWRRSAAAFVVLLTLVTTACSAPGGGRGDGGTTEAAAVVPWSQLTPLADPKSYEGPSTARVTDSRIEPVADSPTGALPVTVTDTQGARVTVTSTDRVLALDLYGSLAATVDALGLGGALVGRDTSTGFPGSEDLPLVTRNGHQLDAESILSLRPTLLLTDTTLGPWDVVLQIRDAGVPVVVLDPKRSLETVSTTTTQVAAALGVPEQGAALTTLLTDQIDAVRAQVDAVAPRDPAQRLRIAFLYARGNAGVYYLFGENSGVDTLVEALDGVDVATEAGIQGYVPLNAEALAKAAPDVILMMTDGLKSVGGVDGALRLPGVGQTPAGAHRRIVDMSDYQVLSFGPLTARVLDALARALYAPDSLGGTR